MLLLPTAYGKGPAILPLVTMFFFLSFFHGCFFFCDGTEYIHLFIVCFHSTKDGTSAIPHLVYTVVFVVPENEQEEKAKRRMQVEAQHFHMHNAQCMVANKYRSVCPLKCTLPLLLEALFMFALVFQLFPAVSCPCDARTIVSICFITHRISKNGEGRDSKMKTFTAPP